MPSTPFHDLDAYLDLPRLSGLALSPDGTRLVTSVAMLDATRTRYVSALWQVDPSGGAPSRQLTRSSQGETGAAFLPDGSLLFTSARPDPHGVVGKDAADPAPKALWLLPAGAGEARVVATRAGGIEQITVARDSPSVVVGTMMLPSAADPQQDAERRERRRDRKVTAILHEGYPIRHWDHDLGPERRRLLAGAAPHPPGPADPASPLPPVEDGIELRDLTGHVGVALDDDAVWDLTPDGSTLVTTWQRAEAGGSSRSTIVVIDVASGRRRTLLDDPEFDYELPSASPFNSHVAVVRWRRGTAEEPPEVSLVVADLSTGRNWEAVPGWPGWPGRATWLPDGSGILVTADENGRAPVFRIDLASRSVCRLTGDDGAYGDLQVSPDGAVVYAMRSAIGSPPAVVRLDAYAVDQRPIYLPGPAPAPLVPGSVTEVTATAEDGTALRAWLVLPASAGQADPAPLLVWIHGGPLSSWNAWSWRWNPWLMAAAGYAVLLPDPALSTGYGRPFVARGWAEWGAAPYTDVMALTDAALRSKDLDPSRTAAMGGSFGGYLANWVAGHTDRFAAIVTHASVWALDQFGPTTDAAHYWRRELTEQMTAEHSPHRQIDKIRTPMLVIHGDRDYRVPVGESLRLWAELAERFAGPDGTLPHKFLYFPDEGHWVLKPQHTAVWYQTVLAFLDHHVRQEPWKVPDLLV